MKMKDLIEALVEERTVAICYEASISTKVRKVIGDVPIYNFVVDYAVEEGWKKEELSTLEELKKCIDENPQAFRKCRICGELITEGFYSNNETGKDYCCKACLTEALDKKYGEGEWLPAILKEKEVFHLRELRHPWKMQSIFGAEEKEEKEGSNDEDTEESGEEQLKVAVDIDELTDLSCVLNAQDKVYKWRKLDIEYCPGFDSVENL